MGKGLSGSNHSRIKLESELQYTERALADMNELLKDIEGGKDLDSVYVPFV